MTFKFLNIQIKTLIDGILKPEVMKEIGKVAKELVVERTSKGFGVPDAEGPKKRLKGLSPSYKKTRKRLKAQGILSSEATVNKSNLTQTRQMLDSVDYKASTGTAEVFLKNSEAKKKAEYQANDDRVFMNLSKTEVNKIKKLIEQKLINDIKKKGL